MRYQFARGVCNRLRTDPTFVNNIIFSDECHFQVGKSINRKNDVIWSTTNPLSRVQKKAHPERVTVWGGISCRFVFMIFCEDTVNTENYVRLIRDDFAPSLRRAVGDRFENMWFMQDGARPHTSNETLRSLHEIFETRVISQRFVNSYNGGMEWPPYSPDLNPCDYFLWGFMKAQLNKKNIINREELRTEICNVFDSIPTAMFKKAIKSFKKRILLVRENMGALVDIPLKK